MAFPQASFQSDVKPTPQGRSGMSLRNGTYITVRHFSGTIAEESLMTGLAAIMNAKADVIDLHGKIILPVNMVVCNHVDKKVLKDMGLRSGAIIKVIDTGDFLIYLRSTKPVPTIPKEFCKSMNACVPEKCDDRCKRCQNNSKK
jgi:hypothetical protein